MPQQLAIAEQPVRLDVGHDEILVGAIDHRAEVLAEGDLLGLAQPKPPHHQQPVLPVMRAQMLRLRFGHSRSRQLDREAEWFELAEFQGRVGLRHRHTCEMKSMNSL